AHLAMSRRLKVDALVGDIEALVAGGERFREAWERAGRPVAVNLAGGPYAVAMAHGLRGDDAARAEWLAIAHELGIDRRWADGGAMGSAPTFDAIVMLHRGDPGAALAHLQVGPVAVNTWYAGQWRAWHGALRAEAAVLAGAGDAGEHIAR